MRITLITKGETRKTLTLDYWMDRIPSFMHPVLYASRPLCIPSFMHPDLSRVENWDDLLFQLSHEIDLAEEGEHEPTWTKKQLHAAKMFAASVHIKAQDFAREYPELVDELNHAV